MQVPVRLRVHIMVIDNINTVQQQFYCRAWIQLRWAVAAGAGEALDTAWRPSLQVLNGADNVQLSERLSQVQDEHGRPCMQMKILIEGNFLERFELHHFPLDQQRLHLRFAIWNCPDALVIVESDDHQEQCALATAVREALQQSNGSSGQGGRLLDSCKTLLLPFKRRVQFWRTADCSIYDEGFVQQDAWHMGRAIVIKQVGTRTATLAQTYVCSSSPT